MSSVDVYIPNYNYGRWVREAIDSVLRQDGVDVRVVVIDNASTDDSVEVIEKARADDPRVHLIKHEKNLGFLTSLNEGVAWCEADYAAFLSSDDRLTTGALRRAAAVMDRHDDVAFVYGPVHVERDGARKPRPRRIGHVGVPRTFDGQAWLWQTATSGHVCIRSPDVVARTSLAKQVGFEHDLPHTSDMAQCLRLAARGNVVHLRGVRQAIYREHAGSMMRTMADPLITDIHARLDAFRVLTTKDAALLENPEGIYETARRALATEAVLNVTHDYARGAADEVFEARMLDTAREIWPGVTATRQWARLDAARTASAHSPARFAALARHELRTLYRRARSRELGQWPAYVTI